MKIIKVKSCGECPHFGLIYQSEMNKPALITGCTCDKMNKCFDTREADSIPSWCPLDDAPDKDEIETIGGERCDRH